MNKDKGAVLELVLKADATTGEKIGNIDHTTVMVAVPWYFDGKLYVEHGTIGLEFSGLEFTH